MKNSTRLISILLIIIIYAILSTSFFTKFLLTESGGVEDVLVFDLGNDNADDAIASETDDDAIDTDNEEEDAEKYTDDTTDQDEKASDQPYTCLSEGAPDILPPTHVLRRSLHGVIIGTQKGGTQALHNILLTHPKILTSSTGHGELHFFNRMYTKLISRYSNVIPRKRTRMAFLKTLKERNNAKRLKRHGGKNDITSSRNTNKVSFHSAPLYLFSGRKIPARMFCTAPWIKVVAILRNPIDRVYSHYHFIYPEKKKTVDTPSFEEFVQADIELLRQYGVLRDWNITNYHGFAGSKEEYSAWERYVNVARGNGPVGRGLYAIQLEIWMDEFQNYNKSLDDLLVLQSESSKEYPQESYHTAVQFFGLEPKTVQKHKHVIGKDHHATNYGESDGMSEDMFEMLYRLYEPYNKRLYKLLGKDWEGVWDEKSDKIVNSGSYSDEKMEEAEVSR